MKTYTVRCEWDDTGVWVVTVPEIAGAVTQSRRLDQVRGDITEVIELMTGDQPGTYEIDLQWSVPGAAGASAQEAHRLRVEAENLAQEVEHVTAEAVHQLRKAGFSYRDIGTMTGVSYQRAQQIAAATSKSTRRKVA